MRYIFLIAILVIVFCCVPTIQAVPVTTAAQNIGSNTFNMTMTGGTPPCWFVWGLKSGYENWKTPNITSTSCSYIQRGSPVYAGETYYFKAVDSTGMSAIEQTVTTTALTPIPTPTIGAVIQNITEIGFDPLIVSQGSLTAYIWMGAPLGVIFGFIFFVIFGGIWIRTRSVSVVAILGLVVSTALLTVTATGIPIAGVGIQLPIAPELILLAQGVMYIMIAGIVTALVKK